MSIGIGDLITFSCLLFDCSDRLSFATQDDVMIIDQTIAAPIVMANATIYSGVGHSSSSVDEARRLALSSVLQRIVMETGLEIKTAHQFLERATENSHQLQVNNQETLRSFNFLNNGTVVNEQINTIKGGYEVVIEYQVEASTLIEMREWSEAVRSLKLSILKTQYINATGVAYKTQDANPYQVRRLAKIRAFQALAEESSSTLTSFAQTHGELLTEESLSISSYSHLHQVETLDTRDYNDRVEVDVRTLNPLARKLIDL